MVYDLCDEKDLKKFTLNTLCLTDDNKHMTNTAL